MDTLMPRNVEAFAAFHECFPSFPALFFLPSNSPVCLPYSLKKENHPGLAPCVPAWDEWTVTHLRDLLDLWRRHILGKVSQFLSHVLSHRARALWFISLEWKEACVGWLTGRLFWSRRTRRIARFPATAGLAGGSGR